MAETLDKRLLIFLVFLVVVAIISSNEKALLAISGATRTLAVGLQGHIKYDPTIPYSDIRNGLNINDFSVGQGIATAPTQDGSLDIRPRTRSGEEMIRTTKDMGGMNVKIVMTSNLFTCAGTGDIPYYNQFTNKRSCGRHDPAKAVVTIEEYDTKGNAVASYGAFTAPAILDVDPYGEYAGESVKYGIIEIVPSLLDSSKFEVFAGGISQGIITRTTADGGSLGVRLNIEGRIGSLSGCCNGDTFTIMRLKSIAWNPSLGCDIRPDDIVVTELFSNDKNISIHDLRYAFPNGGFRKFCAELPPYLLAQGNTGADVNGELLAELSSGREIDLNAIHTPTVQNVESMALTYIVDNSDFKIKTGCDYLSKGEVYDTTTGKCASKNAYVVAVGGGAVIDIEKGTVAIGEKPPCDTAGGFNLFSTAARDGSCPSSEWKLSGSECYVCKQFISQGGICAGSVNEFGECQAKPKIQCPEGSVGTMFDSAGDPTTCTITADNLEVTPIIKVDVEQAQVDAVVAQNPTETARKNVVKAGKGMVFPAAIIAVLIVLGAIVWRRFRR